MTHSPSYVGVGRRGLRGRGSGEHLGDEASILLLALLAAELAEVVVLAIDTDDGEVLRFVVAVLGKARGLEGLGAGNLSVPK